MRPVARLSESGIGVVLHTHLVLSKDGLLNPAGPLGIPTWTGVMEGQCAWPFESDVRSKRRAVRLRMCKILVEMCSYNLVKNRTGK
jgi:hypothetical protein